jgi:protoporphyrinogen/coproporphyrinogen III oxidase
MAPSRNRDADVLVVGAGLAGLAAANRLSERGFRVVVVERDSEPGGRARSIDWEGCTLELGAIFVAGQYRRLRGLIEECGLGDRLDPLPNAFRVAIHRDGNWHHADLRWPEIEVWRYRGVSWREKRSLLRLIPPQMRVAASLRFFDMATAAAVDDRALEAVVGPDVNRYFIGAVTEVFCGVTAEEISLPFGVLGARFPLRRMWMLRGGLGALTRELGERVQARCGIDVERLDVDASGVVATTRAGDSLRARGAVLATRAGEAADLWPKAPDRARHFLTTQAYTQGFGVFLRTAQPVERVNPRGRGVLIDILPSTAGRRALLAAVYLNDLAPSGGLIGLSATPAASKSTTDDDKLAARLEADFRQVHPELALDIAARRPMRWPIFVPWYPMGRAKELAGFRTTLAPGPVQLAGDYLYGPLMEGAVRSGEAAADRMSKHLSGKA